MDRIIGNFLEINADILKQQVDSTLPVFISKLRAKYFRNKLIKSLHKLKENHYILSNKNIGELLTYTFNNFPPQGKYNHIDYSKVITEGLSVRIEAIIKINSSISTINIESESEYFIIKSSIVHDTGEKEWFSLNLDKLYTDNEKYHDIVSGINDVLLDDLILYITEILNHFNK